MNDLKVTYFDTAKLIPDPDNVRQHDRRNIDDFDLFVYINVL